MSLMDPISKADSSQKKIFPKQRSMITLDISMVETFNKKKEEAILQLIISWKDPKGPVNYLVSASNLFCW